MSGSSLARGALCLHRSHRRDPFSADEAAVLDVLAPFVNNHLEKMVSATVLSVLQTAEDRGVIVCDTRGRVLYCNETARDLCSPLGPAGQSANVMGESGGRGGTMLGRPAASSDARGAGVASFVGYALSNPEALGESCHVGVSSRMVELDKGSSGLLITLEPPQGDERPWSEPLKERFALSDREIEVLSQAMDGGTNREIAQALFIAECTVKKHMHSIAAKVGARSRTAIAHAVRQEMGLTH